jgi:hypothetical protein
VTLAAITKSIIGEFAVKEIIRFIVGKLNQMSKNRNSQQRYYDRQKEISRGFFLDSNFEERRFTLIF